jgi:hypothetical protein
MIPANRTTIATRTLTQRCVGGLKRDRAGSIRTVSCSVSLKVSCIGVLSPERCEIRLILVNASKTSKMKMYFRAAPEWHGEKPTR